MMRKYNEKLIFAAASAAALICMQFTAFAGQSAYVGTGSEAAAQQKLPSDTRTAAEWAHLEDNKLEWYEIDDLVHEYNATVLTNRSSFNKDERKTYDVEEVRDYMMDEAAELENEAADYENSGNAVSAALNRMNAITLREQAEDEANDSEIIRLGYEKIEKTTAKSVRENFISYYKTIDAAAYDRQNVEYLEKCYQSAVNKNKYGLATDLDVLTAKETWLTAQAGLVTAESDTETYRKNLTVLCGWKYDGNPEIGELPAFDIAVIDAIDYAADEAGVLEKNYTLRIDARKLADAKESANYTSLVGKYEKQLDDDTRTCKLNFKNVYDSLITARNSYLSSVTQREIAEDNLQLSKKQYDLGTVSNMDYAGTQHSLQAAVNTERTAYYSLLTAYNTYEEALKGVLSIS